MANDVSHVIKPGLTLPFTLSGSTYDPANPKEHVGKAVTITGNATVALTATDARVDGVILAVEPTDGVSVKCSVQLDGILVFMNPEAAASLTGYGLGVVGGATAGSVKDAAADTDSRGKITQVMGDTVCVLF